MKRIFPLMLCAALVTDLAVAAPAILQSVAVTPAARALSVGQKQRYTATGTFSDGSTQMLGAAISDIAPGYRGTCVSLTRGGVDCWGANDFGQLGDGTTTDSRVPRPVKWITNATAVAFGNFHVCALLDNGGVRCWGSNGIGELGNGTRTTFSARPVQVTGIHSAIALGLGWAHSCALLANGTVRCWGYNWDGELGNGTRTQTSTVPVQVTGIHTATALATFETHNCALLASGAVQCWGSNRYGQLGNGTTNDSSTPVTVLGINNATAVAAGNFFSCALLVSGSVRCWGSGASGELGDGRSEPYADHVSTPVPVAGISTAVAITAGAYHACAVLDNGTVWCWGQNHYGQLGNGSLTALTLNTPAQVREISAPVRLVAGYWHTCALLTDGAMRCWGLDGWGELGDRGSSSGVPKPVNVIGTPGVVWQSSDPSKATITMRGRATATAPGNTTITATTAGFVNDNAVLTVK